MRIPETFPYQKDIKDLDTLIQWMKSFFAQLMTSVNGGLGFGDGVDKDNMAGIWVTVADTGAANTDFALAHDIGSVPAGFILMVPPAAGFIYKGATAWTTSNIYLRASVANQAITVFILSPRVVPV